MTRGGPEPIDRLVAKVLADPLLKDADHFERNRILDAIYTAYDNHHN